MKKQGIYIEKHSKTQTKKLYNNGYLTIRYLFQPHSINFKNEMINDDNQHFCGGYSVNNMDLSNDALLNRVLVGKKPMGVIYERDDEKLYNYFKNIDITKFFVEVCKNTITNYNYIIVAYKGNFDDLFDLETLKSDYKNSGIDIDLNEVKGKTLKDFFETWDDNLWITGLMLGYPIENTISIYKDGVR